MKAARSLYVLSVACLILFARPSTGFTSEAFFFPSSSNEPLRERVGVEAELPALAEPSAPDSTESPFSSHQNDRLIQVAIANVPPKPSELEEPVGAIADPFEPINRAFFTFNDRLYFWALKPVASGYKAVAPEVVRVSVRNFFSHVTTPVRLVNCLLQADVKCAGTETARFLLNTTIGFAGFFDSAKTGFNLEKQDRDFGQTLGIWGVGPAFYIDWPILGPSSLRDTIGYMGDLLLDPRTYIPSRYFYLDVGAWVLDKVNETSLTIGEYEDLKKAALDPYIALREAYYQYRQSKIRK